MSQNCVFGGACVLWIYEALIVYDIYVALIIPQDSIVLNICAYIQRCNKI